LDPASAVPLSQHILCLPFEDPYSVAKIRLMMRCLFTASCRNKNQLPGSSHGVFSKTSLRRLHAKQSASTEVVSEVPTSNAARPCRFSRLRRFALLCACRLIASCCQPWDLPGFEPVVDIAASRQTRLAGTDPSELFPSFWPNPVTPTLLPGLPKHVPLSL
jgi:hypothetical protein